MKVYIVGRSRSYASWISGEFELVQNIKEANLAIFTGGEDVSPELYGDTNVSSYDNPSRDLREVREYLSMHVMVVN